MQLRIRSLLGALLLLTGPAVAQVPSTMAPNTVICRLGVSAGPPQACPLSAVFGSSNFQPKTANLTALLALGSVGFPTRTGTDTWAQRTVTGTANEITVTNGTGVSGNPTISLPSAITLTGKTLTGGAYNGTLGATTPSTGAFTSLAVGALAADFTSGGLGPYLTLSTTDTSKRSILELVKSSDSIPDGGRLGQINFGAGSSTKNINAAISAVQSGTAGDAASIALSTSPSGTAGLDTRVWIDKSGNVGIGITSPSTQLHTTGGVRFQGASGAGSAGCVKNDASGNLTLGNTCLSSSFFISASKLATAAVLPNSPTYSNGASGVGATLTAGSNSTLTVDGVIAAANDIILVQNQASSFQNGQYYVSTAGDGSNAWVLTRCTAAACGIQFNTAATMVAGATTFVTAGATNANSTFVLSATVATVGTTGAVFALVSSNATPNQFYVRCDITGGNDCGTTIQAAITSCEAGKGGTVVLPAGTLLVNGGLTITGGCNITGQGWQDYKGYFTQYSPHVYGTYGTYILQTTTANSIFNILNTATGTTLSNFAIVQTHAADVGGWAPTNYPAAIKQTAGTNNGSLWIDHIMLWGVNRGIELGTTSNATGRVNMHSLWGFCYVSCINVQYSADVMRLDDAHFYPFNVNGNSHIVAYLLANAKAIESYRNDTALISNLFVYGFNTCIYASSNAAGSTTKMSINNSACDGSAYGIKIDAGPFTADINGWDYQSDWNGSTGTASSVGIQCSATCAIMASNITIANTQANGIRIDSVGAGADVSVCNLRVNTYSLNAGSFPAVEVASGNTYTGCGRFSATNGTGGAPATGGAGTINVSHVN